MIKMTQKEFDAIPRNERGVKVIPAFTDLTVITNFGDYCIFGIGCSFGERCSFGDYCRFGDSCSFDEYCRFGKDCSFGISCNFLRCCSFGESCSFGIGCQYNKQEFTKYYQFGGFGSVNRTTRAYLLTSGKCAIECGCQIGLTLKQFRERIAGEYKEDTEHGILYRGIANMIEAIEQINNKD